MKRKIAIGLLGFLFFFSRIKAASAGGFMNEHWKTMLTKIQITEDFRVGQLDQLGLSKACSISLEFWLNSLQKFLAALNTNCTALPSSPLCPVEKRMKENLFAVEQLDSFGKIPPELLEFRDYWMGSWEQCLDKAIPEINSNGYKTQFCWLEMVHPTALLLGGQSSTSESSSSDLCQAEKLKPARAHVSVCMPKTCTETEITKILQILPGLQQTLQKNNSNTICATKCRRSEPDFSTGFWIVIAFTISIGIIMLIATAADMLITNNARNTVKPLLAFSMYTNGAEILNMERRLAGTTQIDSVHCIRFLACTMIIAAHVLFLMANAIENPVKVLSVKFWPQYYLTHFTMNNFAVDNFFFLGGLLLAFTFCKEVQKAPGKMRSPSYWMLYYVHRFLRLTPPYIVALAFHAVVLDPIGNGPMDYDQQEHGRSCSENWWLHLLYVNNLFRIKPKITMMCMGHSFYLANDMQMHAFAPILLVPLVARPKMGALFGAGLLVMSTGTNYFAFYSKHINSVFGLDYDKNVYYVPWIRCSPYVIGILTGYFLHRMRNKKLRLHWTIAVILWSISLTVMCLCVAGEWKYNRPGGMSRFLRASYYNFSRIAWAAAISWIVIACQHGFGGPLKNILSQPFWAPLGRLSYCAYLIHMLVVTWFLASVRRPVRFSNTLEVYVHNAIPCICLTFLLSFLWSCAFEIPASKLEKMLIDRLTSVKTTDESPRKVDLTP